MLLEAREYCGTTLDVLCSLLGELGTSLLSLGGSTQTRGHRVWVNTRGSPLVLIHLCLALRPYRCLATAAAGNKDCLSRKGEGKGSRPQTRSHLPSSSPPLPQ